MKANSKQKSQSFATVGNTVVAADEDTGRHIRTVYYADRHAKRVVQTTAARWAFNAVPTCIRRMQINQYEAQLAEVYDQRTGTLHAVIRHTVANEIHILFKREVKEHE